MKTLRTIMFALTVLLLATASQAQQTITQARVPFDFVVGNHTYPAGEYTVKSMNVGSPVMQINNTRDNTVKKFQLSIPCEKLTRSEDSKLVFLRMGDSYFLYQVWVAGQVSGREFPKNETYWQLAQNHEKPELVIVAANITH
jgi:hypothetical protein